MTKKEIIQMNKLLLEEYDKETLMACENCYGLWPNNASFCGFCGKRLTSPLQDVIINFSTLIFKLPNKELGNFIKDLDKLIDSYITGPEDPYYKWNIDSYELPEKYTKEKDHHLKDDGR